ncbi:helix-turn-helix domain-containing protein [Noviherbaspirillum cavernae]|uniref:helix-turn-helix domain-containing protein n=1 Tax=Noviherbaspirillum cavernae TaxID=2320862 RepID=UPI0011C35B5A|nr:helix-turn-helix transcriptional regulator [Noviherbaspirillum cavernae]
MTEEKMQFVARLVDVTSMLGYPEHGRQTQLASHYKVTQGAARKWFAGETMPSYEICADMCKRAQVHYEWLMTGRGTKSIHAAQPLLALVYLDPEELSIITAFREATPIGKASISTAAETAPRAESLNIAPVRNQA